LQPPETRGCCNVNQNPPGELTYFVEARSASEIAERFGYSKASVQTLVSLAGGARRLMDFPVRSH